MLADNPVVIDFETVEILPDGSTRGSTEYYRENFRVDSCAFTERRNGEIVSWFIEGEDAVKAELIKLGDRPLVAHNLAFDAGVALCRYPDLKLNWYCDTMRLVQVYDNAGGDEAFERIVLDPVDFDDEELAAEENIKFKPITGTGLVMACKRILGLEDHKLEAHTWIYANVPGVKKGQAGGHLNKLPRDILERYNVLDTERTLALYEHITEHFLLCDYDWEYDHALFLSTVGHVIRAKIRGVRVDRDGLIADGEKVLAQIAEIERVFTEQYSKEIAEVERMRLLKRIRKLKTFKGRKNYVKKVRDKGKTWQKDIAFKVGSNAQLQMLFVDVLKMVPKFFTAKGSPAFKSTMLSQWGPGGEMLGERRKKFLILKQICNLHKLSEYDGRFHVDLKTASVSTGRFAGGSVV